jgi:hypothetical protein
MTTESLNDRLDALDRNLARLLGFQHRELHPSWTRSTPDAFDLLLTYCIAVNFPVSGDGCFTSNGYQSFWQMYEHYPNKHCAARVAIVEAVIDLLQRQQEQI